MKTMGAKIGIACDGDADRFVIVDEDRTYISPNYVIALLFDYLVETRGLAQWGGQERGDHKPDQRGRQAS